MQRHTRGELRPRADDVYVARLAVRAGPACGRVRAMRLRWQAGLQVQPPKLTQMPADDAGLAQPKALAPEVQLRGGDAVLGHAGGRGRFPSGSVSPPYARISEFEIHISD
eukprot:scaffold9928_cov112-Isochrysis_galbana.AAC.12